jgi:diguanylate cyclase (GGDEF)-like protein/putative nucleotidyltransferase with HDIG domain
MPGSNPTLASADSPRKTPLRLNGLCILVLDDEEPIRRVLEYYLVSQGCTVKTAPHGRAGLDLLLREEFDLVVVDLQMAEMDGIAFIEEARRIWPGLGVIPMTGYADIKAETRLRDLGCWPVLTKPISWSDLTERALTEIRAGRERVGVLPQLNPERVQKQLRLLSRISEAALSHQDAMEAFEGLSVGLGQIVERTIVGVFGLEDYEQILTLNLREPVAHAVLEQVQEEVLRRCAALVGRPVAGWTVHLQVKGEIDPDVVFVPDVLTVPLISAGEVRGLLVLAGRPGEPYATLDLTFLYNLAGTFATILWAIRKLQASALHDYLTGADNRAHFEAQFDIFWKLAVRRNQPITLALLDVDQFKSINDCHGHVVGDQVLKEVAGIIRGMARASDIVARYGGDEFIILLPQTGVEAGQSLAQRICDAVSRHVVEVGGQPVQFTISIGVASCRPQEGRDQSADLFNRADLALYESKRRGRNCVSSAPVGENELPPAEVVSSGPEAATAPWILVVDDDPDICRVMEVFLESQGHRVKVSGNAREALEWLDHDGADCGVVFSDLSMPEIDGFTFLAEVGRRRPDCVGVVITGFATKENAVDSLRRGAFDFVEKPLQMDGFLAVAARALEHFRLRRENRRYHLHLEAMVEARNAELVQALAEVRRANESILETFVLMLDARDPDTNQHSLRVRKISRIIGEKLGLKGVELATLETGALLHDIGKIALPDAILMKVGKPNEAEWEQIRSHPENGFRILQACSWLSDAAEIVRSHHERIDGKGYPRALSVDHMGLGARIVMLADSYDTMRSRRVYRAPLDPDYARKELIGNRGTQFDTEVVDAFLACEAEIERAVQWSLQGEDGGCGASG